MSGVSFSISDSSDSPTRLWISREIQIAFALVFDLGKRADVNLVLIAADGQRTDLHISYLVLSGFLRSNLFPGIGTPEVESLTSDADSGQRK